MRFPKFFLVVTCAVFTLALAFTANFVTAQTPSTCSDVAYLRQIKSDFTKLGSTQPDITKPDELSAALVTTINLRYKEEDTAAPAGCEAVKTTVVKLLGLYEDQAAMKLAALADAPNKATYDSLVSDTIAPRANGLSQDFSVVMGVKLGGGDESGGEVATPESTAAGS